MAARVAPVPPAAPPASSVRRQSRRGAPVLLAAVLLLAFASLPHPAQAASTSPAVPTAILAQGVDSVGPELQPSPTGTQARLSARANAVEEETTTTRWRATTTSAVAAAETGARVVAATAEEDVAATVAPTVISSITDDLSAGASTSLAAASPTDGSTSASAASSSTSSAAVSTSTAVPEGYKLPQAFDSTLGTNFTSTACPSFFATFLADPTFQSCAPFSLLLTTSTGFFQAERSPRGLLPYVLNASCTAPQTDCVVTMSSFARNIQLKNTCGPDLALGNPLATEALQGFQSYELMREAGCAKNNDTAAQYCFAEASAKTDPSDLYYYYLPEGTTLPSGTAPTCDFCTQNLLGIYARYASNSTLAIARTYASGRSAASLACGPDFAPAIAVQSTVSSALRHSPPILAALLALVTAATLAIAGL